MKLLRRKKLEANRIDELVDHYTKQYENEKPENPIYSNYAPVINTPHMELSPLPSVRRVNRNDRNETCHNNNIREHTQTYVQALA